MKIGFFCMCCSLSAYYMPLGLGVVWNLQERVIESREGYTIAAFSLLFTVNNTVYMWLVLAAFANQVNTSTVMG